ncbi:hypothetical protein KDAU_42880 [Dictyobacter aurantiacus]|uniref:Uncharacterized protein n=2 Tax=Dictyobacter aurantiacus TaxID=1936993 RepID=A0A401ZJE1_9CHLR|nr:hypothetical protein KDAU_42880 [Dictyobacter aurantiacus]
MVSVRFLESYSRRRISHLSMVRQMNHTANVYNAEMTCDLENALGTGNTYNAES